MELHSRDDMETDHNPLVTKMETNLNPCMKTQKMRWRDVTRLNEDHIRQKVIQEIKNKLAE